MLPSRLIVEGLYCSTKYPHLKSLYSEVLSGILKESTTTMLLSNSGFKRRLWFVNQGTIQISHLRFAVHLGYPLLKHKRLTFVADFSLFKTVSFWLVSCNIFQHFFSGDHIKAYPERSYIFIFEVRSISKRNATFKPTSEKTC